jgi:hypothetical protein
MSSSEIGPSTDWPRISTGTRLAFSGARTNESHRRSAARSQRVTFPRSLKRPATPRETLEIYEHCYKVWFESEPSKFERAALRWHGRYCREVSDVDLAEAQAVLACLAGLRGTRPEPAAHALADLVHRRDLARASEVLNRWGATWAR